jgi:hypothetical protein
MTLGIPADWHPGLVVLDLSGRGLRNGEVWSAATSVHVREIDRRPEEHLEVVSPEVFEVGADVPVGGDVTVAIREPARDELKPLLRPAPRASASRWTRPIASRPCSSSPAKMRRKARSSPIQADAGHETLGSSAAYVCVDTVHVDTFARY